MLAISANSSLKVGQVSDELPGRGEANLNTPALPLPSDRSHLLDHGVLSMPISCQGSRMALPSPLVVCSSLRSKLCFSEQVSLWITHRLRSPVTQLGSREKKPAATSGAPNFVCCFNSFLAALFFSCKGGALTGYHAFSHIKSDASLQLSNCFFTRLS